MLVDAQPDGGWGAVGVPHVGLRVACYCVGRMGRKQQ